MFTPVSNKLRQLGGLAPEEKRVLLAAPTRLREVPRHQDIVSEGARLGESCLILQGFACRYKLLPGGKRQILAFQIPGDFCDIQSFILDVMDHGICCLTRCKLAVYPHATLRQITERYPAIHRALWKETLVDASVYREWMASIGRRNAYQRIAHLLCEIMTRLQAVGLATGHSCEFPVTQADIGDSLGLSVVHVNRVLQQMRRKGLITFHDNTLVIHQWEQLAQAGEFDASYLQLTDPPKHERKQAGDGVSMAIV
jgi:CRP-like cAMP-binding protein